MSVFNQVATAPQRPLSLLTDMFAGHTIEGGVTSTTVTSNVHVEKFPLASVEVRVTV